MISRQFPFQNLTPTQPPMEFVSLHPTEPVSTVIYPSGQEAYLVVKYDDVKRVLSDYRTFSRAAAGLPDAPRVGAVPIQPDTILSLDPPDHTRLRAVLGPHFTKRAVAVLEESLTQSARTLLGEAFARGRECELVSAFTRPFPTYGIMSQLGIPPEYFEDICHWSDRAMAAPAADRDLETLAFEHLRSFFRRLIAAGEIVEGQEALLPKLVQAQRDDLLTENEMLQAAVTVVVAGHETTVSMLGKCIYRLIENVALLERLRAEMAEPTKIVRELLRTSSSGGGSFIRITTKDVALSGVTIPAGSAVSAPPTGANLDPEIYPEPLRVDPDRDTRPAMSFGAGPHRCLGEHLALLQLKVALREFVAAMPADLRLAAAPQERQWIGNRPLAALRVAWGQDHRRDSSPTPGANTGHAQATGANLFDTGRAQPREDTFGTIRARREQAQRM